MSEVPVQTDTLTSERDAAARFRGASKSPNTTRAYLADLAHYEAWCQERELSAIPATPDTVATYLAALAEGTAPGALETRDGARWSTASIARRRTTIGRAHRLLGLPDPCDDEAVRDTLRGIRKTRGRDTTPKEPVSVAMLRVGLGVFGAGTHDTRDRALVLLGFGSALRRSELASLDLADVSFQPEGVLVRLRRGKRGGRDVGVPRGGVALDPVAALRTWLGVRGRAPGPLFFVVRGEELRAERMHPQQVMAAVRRVAEHAGCEPALFGGHSLRSGFATSASHAGWSLQAVMAQTGHIDPRTAMGYVRRGKVFENPAAELLK